MEMNIIRGERADKENIIRLEKIVQPHYQKGDH